MPNWGKLLSAFAEGGDPAAFARVRAQKEENINNQHRRALLDSAEGRAQANEARESEQNTYNIGRRGAKEKADELALTQAGLSVEEARIVLKQKEAQRAAYELAGGSQGEANETMAERKRREQDQTIEQEKLALERRRTATGESQEAGLAQLRAEQLRDAQRRNRFGDETYTGSVGAENYNNSEEAREERRRAANLAGLRNAGSEGPIYDSIANDLMEIDARRKQRRQGASAPPQKPVKERAGSSATAWKPRKDK